MNDNLKNDILDIVIKQLNADRFENDLIKKSDINDTDLLFDDLGADDLNMIEIFMELEEEFAIELDDDLIQTSLTVGGLIDIINIQCRDKHK